MNFSRALLVAVLVTPAIPVQAQEADQADQVDASVGDSSPGVADIVVTAQFREQNLQDVPIAIDAVGGEQLATSGVRSADDLPIATTGLTIQRQTGASLVYIRGVGTAGGQPANEGAVATFVDGVYQPSPSSLTGSLANIERVEVLKGPQGTLYGRNATGGAINIVTLKPSFQTKGTFEFGYGNLETVEARGYLTTGITGKIAADTAFYYGNQDKGFGTNLFTGTEIYKGRDFVVRSKILFELGEDTDFTLAGDYSSSQGSLGAPQRVAPGAVLIDGIGLSDLPGSQSFPGGFHDVYSDVDPFVRKRVSGVTGTLMHDFGDISLTSITAYIDMKQRSTVDADATSIAVTTGLLDEDDSQFTQELRLQGETGLVSWLLGGFFLDSKAGYSRFEVLGLGVQQSFGGAPDAPDRLLVLNNIQKTRSYAAFGQATWALGETTNLTGGLRYTRDRRSINPDAFVGFTADPDLLIPIPVALGAVQPGGDTSDFFKQSATFSKVTWRLSLDHQFTPDLMGYISYNRGFKSGVFNTSSFGDPAVKPEVLDAYEAGIKSTILDNRVRLNAAAYYYDYANIQLTQLLGSQQLLLNAAAAEIYGGELSVDAAVTDHLSLRGGVAYTHGRYEKFANAPIFSQAPGPGFGSSVTSGDGSGNETVFTPPWQFNVSADYTVPVGEAELSANLTYAYVKKYYYTADNNSEQPSYDIVNGQIRLDFNDGLSLRVWGRNLFDTHYYSNTYNSAAGENVVVAPGRTYGMSVGMKL